MRKTAEVLTRKLAADTFPSPSLKPGRVTTPAPISAPPAVARFFKRGPFSTGNTDVSQEPPSPAHDKLRQSIIDTEGPIANTYNPQYYQMGDAYKDDSYYAYQQGSPLFQRYPLQRNRDNSYGYDYGGQHPITDADRALLRERGPMISSRVTSALSNIPGLQGIGGGPMVIHPRLPFGIKQRVFANIDQAQDRAIAAHELAHSYDSTIGGSKVPYGDVRRYEPEIPAMIAENAVRQNEDHELPPYSHIPADSWQQKYIAKYGPQNINDVQRFVGDIRGDTPLGRGYTTWLNQHMRDWQDAMIDENMKQLKERHGTSADAYLNKTYPPPVPYTR